MKTEPNACCICNDPLEGMGNNPEPFKGERCCDDCNDRFVTPTRMCLGRGYSDESILLREIRRCQQAGLARLLEESSRRARGRRADDTQVLTLLESLQDLNWVGMDCVEVAPPYDHADITSLAAATFVWTYLCGRLVARSIP